MVDNLRVSVIQTELFWEDKKQNLNHFSTLISTINDTDLIVLPEMFTTGFSMNCSALFDEHPGKTLAWMQEIAQKKKVAITGSAIIKENNSYYNRLYFVFPNGEFKTYDKRHLFRMADETSYYTAGKEKIIVEYKGWKICPLICFDLRFPVFSRNKYHADTNQFDYDCLIYVANWPAARRKAWNCLLEARAHENLCYVVGVNRIGLDGTNKNYAGDTHVFDFKGTDCIAIEPEKEAIATIELDKPSLTEYRSKFNTGLDADIFSLK